MPDFSDVVRALKDGLCVTRDAWNGEGMPLELELREPNAKSEMTLPYIYMFTADKHLVPWTPSQTDILAEDWVIL